MTEEERKKLKVSVSQNKATADSLQQQYLDRGTFSWDPESDAGFQNYAKLMREQGELAMKDTAAKAASLTGGYGNSYATAAAGQTYNQYLNQIDQKANDYYAMALDAFQREEDDLLNKLSVAKSAWEEDYNRLYEDAATRAQYGDTADYTALLGVDDQTYRGSFLSPVGTEQVEGYLAAAERGVDYVERYEQMLANQGYDISSLPILAEGYVSTDPNRDVTHNGDGTPSVTNNISTEVLRAGDTNGLVEDLDEYKIGQNFKVHVDNNTYKVKLGDCVANAKSTGTLAKLVEYGNRNPGLGVYNGELYYFSRDQVFRVEARGDRTGDLMKLKSYVANGIEGAEG